MEVLRFQQNAAGGGKQEDYIAMFGSDEIAIKKRTDNGADTTYQLDFIVPGGALPAGSPGNQSPINILAKPSDFIEAYLEDTEGLVEGVREVFYSNQIVLREIGDAAKRNTGDDAAAFGGFTPTTAGAATADYGLNAVTETMKLRLLRVGRQMVVLLLLVMD